MNATEWKLGMSTCCTHNTNRETFDAYAKNGIDCMEVCPDPAAALAMDWKKLRRDADETGVQLWSFHLPYYPFETTNPASPDPQVRKKTIETQSELIRHCGETGIGVCVIHPSGEPNPDEDRNDRLLFARETLSKLADVANAEGVTLAAEDLPRSCIGNCAREIAFLTEGNDKLRVCLDTNHLLTESNADFIRALGSKIVTLHVSDYDFVDEKHWLPYEGKNDWVEIVTLLEEAGYRGPFLYEVGFGKPRALNRRELTFADFQENYLACVNKVKAKVIPPDRTDG